MTNNTTNLFNAVLTIAAVSIAMASLFFAMFGQFEAMLICLSLSFVTSLLIK